ncbi:hypothetical protein AAY473_012243 [Plecturocebus cupreus]
MFFIEIETPYQVPLCRAGWSAMSTSLLTATSASRVQATLPASASPVAEITGARYHTWLIFLFLVERVLPCWPGWSRTPDLKHLLPAITLLAKENWGRPLPLSNSPNWVLQGRGKIKQRLKSRTLKRLDLRPHSWKKCPLQGGLGFTRPGPPVRPPAREPLTRCVSGSPDRSGAGPWQHLGPGPRLAPPTPARAAR